VSAAINIAMQTPTHTSPGVSIALFGVQSVSRIAATQELFHVRQEFVGRAIKLN
jgi:hypothetical protein